MLWRQRCLQVFSVFCSLSQPIQFGEGFLQTADLSNEGTQQVLMPREKLGARDFLLQPEAVAL
ncbi:MAG: hypothetical protein A2286_05225 [Gammaproteobacteria bacterium RIFOXYA12_FULL_61_12]|nr:MAG: hypothetical protein A2286_05225 [Gammaproteobacteria bacterium RIFOXYA12_FULL_61_12]